MRRRPLLAATVVVCAVAFASSARAEDWSVERRVDGVRLSGTGDLLLSGDDVVVTGFGRAWLLDGATGETLATCLDVLAPEWTERPRYLATPDLLLAIAGEDYMLFGLRTGTPMSASAGASFAVAHGGLFSLSGGDRPIFARIEPMGRDGWTKDVGAAAGLETLGAASGLTTLTASKSGFVLSGPGGFVELDPAGRELRGWKVAEPERSTMRRDACRTQVVDDLVLVSLQFPDGTAKLRVFKGKRPRELSLQGQTAPGVLTLDDQAWRDPFVVRRGSREWVLVELEHDHDLPGAQLEGTHAYVAVDLSRASAGPVVVAQRSSIARSGRAIQGQPGGKVVDLVTGETSPRPEGSTWSVADSFWYQVEDSTLRYGDLEGGEPKTLPLPSGATVSTSEAAPLEDFLIFSAGGGKAPATVGTVDLRRGRVEVLQTIDEGHDLQVSDYVVNGKAVFFLLRLRAGERGAESLRIVRRSR